MTCLHLLTAFAGGRCALSGCLPQRDRSVEDQMLRRRVLVDHEEADPLQLAKARQATKAGWLLIRSSLAAFTAVDPRVFTRGVIHYLSYSAFVHHNGNGDCPFPHIVIK